VSAIASAIEISASTNETHRNQLLSASMIFACSLRLEIFSVSVEDIAAFLCLI